jgi:modulator of FtsH protease
MTAYEPAAWHDLFVTVGGSAAALTGLIFVSVSINLREIIASPHLPVRAAETLSILVAMLLLSLFLLAPGQSRTVLGAEILALGAAMAGMLLTIRTRLRRAAGEPLTWTVVPVAIILAATIPVIVAGTTLLAGAGGGLYWLLPALVFGFAGAVFSAWILLIEILR